MNFNSKCTPFVVSSDAPEITTMSRSEDIVHVGETLTLDCSFVGFPTPNITWMLNNSFVFSAESGVSVNTTQAGSGSTSRLTFTNVTMARAQGNYSCIVFNVVGNTNRNFNIFVARELRNIGCICTQRYAKNTSKNAKKTLDMRVVYPNCIIYNQTLS